MEMRRRKYRNVTGTWDTPYKCGVCGSEQFYVTVQRDGTEYVRRCKLCQLTQNEKTWARRKQIPEFIERKNVQARETQRHLKQAAIAAYGGVCACCGEWRFELLSVDHIKGRRDGIDLKQKDRGTALYYTLRNLNYPKDGNWQLLCMGCNFAKGRFKECPHVTERRELQAQGGAIAMTEKLRHQLIQMQAAKRGILEPVKEDSTDAA